MVWLFGWSYDGDGGRLVVFCSFFAAKTSGMNETESKYVDIKRFYPIQGTVST